MEAMNQSPKIALNPTYLNLLKLSSGILWTLTYLIIIHRGFVDHTYGMPMLALSANITWEFLFAFIFPHKRTQRIVDITWFLIDLVIVYQYLRYGDYPWLFLLSLPVSGWIIIYITRRFNDPKGQYTAFGQNLLMSVLFIIMVLQRGDLSGQSAYVALFKLLGTAIPSISLVLFYPPERSPAILRFFFVSIFLADLVYLGLVLSATTRLGVGAWVW